MAVGLRPRERGHRAPQARDEQGEEEGDEDDAHDRVQGARDRDRRREDGRGDREHEHEGRPHALMRAAPLGGSLGELDDRGVRRGHRQPEEPEDEEGEDRGRVRAGRHHPDEGMGGVDDELQDHRPEEPLRSVDGPLEAQGEVDGQRHQGDVDRRYTA